MNRYIHFVFLLFLFLVFNSCQTGRNPENTLHIIHAGSLTLPVHELAKAFREEYQGVQILTEAWGSKAGARRVADLNTPADLFMSADYMVIENLLIPEHANWYIPFATNELAIVFTDRSRMAGEINNQNWPDILLRPDIKFGRSNPDMDPCGVRSVFTIKLAEKYFNRPGLAQQLLSKDTDNIRPKETDLIPLLEANHVDYIFLYRSVAIQHGLNYLHLPDSLSLGNFALNDWYSRVSVETLGARPGETVTEYGEAMVYGLTIPFKVQNQPMAKAFIEFVLHPEKGQAILQRLGQDPVFHFENPYQEVVDGFFRE